MARSFASRDDHRDRPAALHQVAPDVYVYVAEGDPNSGVIVGRDAVAVVDAQATPTKTRALRDAIGRVTPRPVRYLVLTHHHAVRVLGAPALAAAEVIAARGTLELIEERGEANFASERERFPRLFADGGEIPGLVRPSLAFDDRLTLRLPPREIEVRHPGRGHTRGDGVVWLPDAGVLFTGDLVGNRVSPYTGDAYLADWLATLDRLVDLRPRVLVPGRGLPVAGSAVGDVLAATRGYLETLLEVIHAGVARGDDLPSVYRAARERLEPAYGTSFLFDHCLPFNVARAYEEALGIRDPQVWTHRRDVEMWRELEGLRVARPGGTEEPRAVAVIRSEHLSFHTVTHLFGELVNDLEAGRMDFDAELFRLILDYIASYIGIYHHPKEEQSLFTPLRERVPEAAALLQRLEAEHRSEENIRERLEDAHRAAAAGEPEAVERFVRVAESYLRLGRAHTTLEETELLPLAMEKLTAADWARIDHLFDDHESPIYGADQKERYRALLRRITYRAPAPHGLGGGG